MTGVVYRGVTGVVYRGVTGVGYRGVAILNLPPDAQTEILEVLLAIFKYIETQIVSL